jgi:hypothetical protein
MLLEDTLTVAGVSKALRPEIPTRRNRVEVLFVGILLVTFLLSRSAQRDKTAPGEMLKLRLEQYTQDVEPELAVDGHALTMKRRSIIALMTLVFICGAPWVPELLKPWFDRAGWSEHSAAKSYDAAMGVLIVVGTLVVMALAMTQLFTQVDGRGIQRPWWVGGNFIPWSSVTEVSVVETGRALVVKAGKRKALLGLPFFCDPSALVTLIRRHVPADRLKGM